MSSIIDLREFFTWRRSPVLVLVDLYHEHAAVRALCADAGVSSAIANCRAALALARAKRLPVAYVRHAGSLSNPKLHGVAATWLPGLQPTRSDMIFEREQHSCYASHAFADMMDNVGGNFVMAGLFGEVACLSTAVDAFHRYHRFTYLADASASRTLGEIAASTVQDYIAKLITLYGRVADTAEWIATMSEPPTARHDIHIEQ